MAGDSCCDPRPGPLPAWLCVPLASRCRRVPKDNLVGQINKGWTMAKNLLGFERIGSGSPRQSSYALSRLRLLAERMGVWDEEWFQDRYTRLRLDLASISQTRVSWVCEGGCYRAF